MTCDHVMLQSNDPFKVIFNYFETFLRLNHSYSDAVKYYFRGDQLYGEETPGDYDNFASCELITASLRVTISFVYFGSDRTFLGDIRGWTTTRLRKYTDRFTSAYVEHHKGGEAKEFDFYFRAAKIDCNETLGIAFWNLSDMVLVKERM